MVHVVVVRASPGYVDRRRVRNDTPSKMAAVVQKTKRSPLVTRPFRFRWRNVTSVTR